MEQMLGRTAEELALTDWFGDAPRVVDISPPGGGRRPLGSAPDDVPAGRTAARSAGAVGRQPPAARAGAPGVAAADSRHRPRARQLARPDQVDRRQPRDAAAAQSAADDWRDDMQRGLQVIASRTDSLSRFTGAYARLARLPAPQARARRAEAAAAARRRPRDARAGPGRGPAPTSPSTPTPISSSSC